MDWLGGGSITFFTLPMKYYYFYNNLLRSGTMCIGSTQYYLFQDTYRADTKDTTKQKYLSEG